MNFDMEKVSSPDISRILRNTPILIFLFLGIVLTHSSMFFPQNLGQFQKVAGWPLTMYKAEYQLEGNIEPTGRIIRRIVQEEDQLIWSRVFLNIVLWTFLLYGTWWLYEKSNMLKFRRMAK